jgi:Ni,Fe-hydrogenase I large subunit
VHYVEIDGTASARVLDYRVLAPTEWNFHPRGALAVTLAGRRAGSLQALRREAQRLIDALDPCVACVLQLHEEAVIA